MSGKGDTYRPVDWDKWSKNYDRIFRNVATSSAIESGRDPESYRCPKQRQSTATEAQETAGKLDESGGENVNGRDSNPTTGGGTS